MIGASNDAAIGFESEFAELQEGVVRLIGEEILIAIVEEKGKASLQFRICCVPAEISRLGPATIESHDPRVGVADLG